MTLNGLCMSDTRQYTALAILLYKYFLVSLKKPFNIIQIPSNYSNWKYFIHRLVNVGRHI